MVRIGIRGDGECARKMVGGLLERYFVERKMEYQFIEYGSGKEVLEWADEKDILLMDMEVGEISEIQIKDMLLKEGGGVKILFLTDHIEGIIKAFGKNVYGFLSKPVEEERLGKCLDQMLENVEENENIVIKSVNRERLIRLKDIFYFVSEKKYSRMVGREGEQFCDMGLCRLEEMLRCQSFFRCHRSYLVNLGNISKIEEKIYMENGDEVPVSRRKSRELKESYQMYVIRRKNRNPVFQE